MAAIGNYFFPPKLENIIVCIFTNIFQSNNATQEQIIFTFVLLATLKRTRLD